MLYSVSELKGLRNQLIEVRAKGEKAIKREVLFEKIIDFDLNERQKKH